MNPQRPFKRQKTMGPLITRYPVPPTSTNFAPNHPPPNSAHRALTHPPLNANLPQYTNTSTVVSPNSYAVRAWQHQNQLPSTLHRHPSQQWISQGSPSPISTSPISSAGGAPVQNVFPPKAYVQHHSPARTPPLRNSFPDRPSGRPPQGSLISHQSSSVSQTEFSIQSQQSEAPKGESEEQAAESWWEELRALDYPEDSYEPKHVGELVQKLLIRNH